MARGPSRVRSPRGPRGFSNVIAFDDAPFDRTHRGDVPVVGAVFAETRLDGVVVTRVRRDGANAAQRLAEALVDSRFHEHVQLILLQGVAMAGFNVVDVPDLAERTGRPVLVVARRAPDLDAIRRALLGSVRGGRRKWALIERLGPMEPMGSVYVQRAGIDATDARVTLDRLTVHGSIPEPIRVAHVLVGAWGEGRSRGRA